MLISASDIINRSIALYRDNRQLFLRYMAWLFVPTVLVYLFAMATGADRAAPMPRIAIMIFPLLVVVGIAALWISIAFVRTIANRYEGKPTKSLKDELSIAKSLLFPVILSSILSGLAVLGGFILFIIPGIIFSLWFSFVFYAVAIDGKQAVDSLSASKELVKGRWWSVWWRLAAPGFVFGLLVTLGPSIVAAPFEILVKNLPAGSPSAIIIATISILLSTAAQMLLTPLSTVAITILYMELKKNPLPTTSSPLPPSPPTA